MNWMVAKRGKAARQCEGGRRVGERVGGGSKTASGAYERGIAFVDGFDPSFFISGEEGKGGKQKIEDRKDYGRSEDRVARKNRKMH
jgi:hypothetical protein